MFYKNAINGTVETGVKSEAEIGNTPEESVVQKVMSTVHGNLDTLMKELSILEKRMDGILVPYPLEDEKSESPSGEPLMCPIAYQIVQIDKRLFEIYNKMVDLNKRIQL